MKFRRKTFLLFVCVALFSCAWLLFTNAVRDQQNIAFKESSSLKIRNAEKTLTRLYNMTALQAGGVQKPASFVIQSDLNDLTLKQAFLSPRVKGQVLFRDLKKSYLDSLKNKTGFFTVDLGKTGRFLVRADKKSDFLEFAAFPLNAVLNALTYDVQDSEWYVVDSKNVILASKTLAYIGQRRSAEASGFINKSLGLGGEVFKISLAKPKQMDLALVNILGVLGLCLLAWSLYSFANVGVKEQSLSVAASPQAEDLVQETLKQASAYEPQIDLPEEDVAMVDLTTAKPLNAEALDKALDYSQFLMDNPVLGGDSVASESMTPPPLPKLGETASIEPSPEMEPAANDWLKLAEDLSKNIDEFAAKMQKEKDSADETSADI